MDAEDIGKDILFPQRALGLLRSDDRDFIAACFCAYNEIVMDHVKPHRDRLFPIGFLPYWDEASVREGGAQLKDLGFKAMMMPSLPPGVFYNSRQLDGMWTAIEKTGLPLSFHVGETFDARGLGGLATTVVVAFGGYRRLWSLLTFSGILERHLGLRIVFTEGGIAWVPSALFEADKTFESEMNPRLANPPSHYWFNNCYATFMDDLTGLRQIGLIGADRIMWTYDYPHPESTLGYTQESIRDCFEAGASVEDGQKIVGQNAIDLWGLDS
jgi:predicted TIM-barrel fold metal-dependent hydrolase